MSLPFIPYSKETQLKKTRNKPLARQRGAITPKVRNQLKERSGGICERPICNNQAVHAAHITRRWKLKETKVTDLLHLCITCHIWADQTEAGREYLKMMEEAKENA